MAAVLRIEKVRLDRKEGISKVGGTLFCVEGASVITLYKGPTIYSPAPRLHIAAAPSLVGDADGKSWTLGCIFLISHCLSWSGWLVFQAPVLNKYPARLSFTSYQCFFGILQFLLIAAFVERDPQAWLVHSGAELFSVFYVVRRYQLYIFYSSFYFCYVCKALIAWVWGRNGHSGIDILHLT
ncbi:protein walls are thin 1 [Phtheirospermum japonicum]|uniref:Protein walls are thin 1 n=1 Tax=Phtheirospermum japonicum TaxID=374723 RepID=A0A830BFX7_9LAMI|nr:protein walls are thin 1 [Phtheirospermum japonicum]